MQYTGHFWDQIKNLSADRLIKALEKDGWEKDISKGAVIVYRHPDKRRITVHYHPRKTYGPKLLKELLADIGWNEEDFKRLKLIK